MASRRTTKTTAAPPPPPVSSQETGRTFTANEVERIKDLVFNATLSRFALAQQSVDGRRDLDRECGYPTEPTVEEYQKLFDREPYAARVVELMPKETWQVTPTVYEDEESEDKTEFEEAWDALGESLRPERSYHRQEEGSVVWDYLFRADVLSGIGGYGVILLGLDDGLPLSQPANRREGQQLTYLRVFPQTLAPITQLETDVRSPRYGQPVQYSITFNDPSEMPTGGAVIGVGSGSSTSAVHWTRVVHVADVHHVASPCDWFAVPRMRTVLNPLLDIRKIRAADGEGYWRAVVNLLSLETHPQLGGDVDIDKTVLRQQLENFYNGLQRDLVTSGMTVKTLSPTVTDPTPHIEANVQAICVLLGVPVRIFKGSERGELASSQDDDAWNDRLDHRQKVYVTPRLIVPFVDRLISLGCLPEPEDGYVVAWPDVTSRSETEKATVASQRTAAMAQYVSGGVEALMPPMDYLTRELGYDEDEAEAILDAAAEAEEDKLAEQQAQADELGMKVQPPPGMIDPEQQKAEQEIQLEQAKAGGGKGKPGGFPPKGSPKPTDNAFCPTGEGGGIDNSCSPTVSGDHIGKKWDSVEGPREVVGVITVGGEERLLVKTGDTRQHEIISLGEIEKTISRDGHHVKSVKDREAKKIAESQIQKTERQHVNGFLSSKSPVARSKAEEALGVMMQTTDGSFKTRREIVEDMVLTSKAVVKPHPKDKRRLERESGYIEEKRLTKTAMDYAEYLIEISKGESGGK